MASIFDARGRRRQAPLGRPCVVYVMLQPQSLAVRTRRSIADIDDTAVADPAQWYQRRLAGERDSGEPELGILPLLVPAGATVLDVGANLGLFAFAMSQWAAHVHGFEPHPELAAFAQRMLAGCAQIHAMAVSDYVGHGRFRVPYTDADEVLHFAGNLCSSHSQCERYDEYDVDVVTLDSLNFVGVRFIKIDVEGAELQVLAGAKALIACDRPILLVELLAGTYADPAGAVEAIAATYNYDPFILHAGCLEPARQIIAGLNSNSTWGSIYRTRNVLFRPK